MIINSAKETREKEGEGLEKIIKKKSASKIGAFRNTLPTMIISLFIFSSFFIFSVILL